MVLWSSGKCAVQMAQYYIKERLIIAIMMMMIRMIVMFFSSSRLCCRQHDGRRTSENKKGKVRSLYFARDGMEIFRWKHNNIAYRYYLWCFLWTLKSGGEKRKKSFFCTHTT